MMMADLYKINEAINSSINKWFATRFFMLLKIDTNKGAHILRVRDI